MPAPLHIQAGRLVEVLGLADALRLVSHFGGGSLYLPHPSRLRDGNKVVMAIGMPAAARLCVEWPQLDVTFPRLSAALRRARDRAIRANAESLSVTQLAWRFATTERHVYRVRAGGGEDCEPANDVDRSQLDLFSRAD